MLRALEVAKVAKVKARRAQGRTNLCSAEYGESVGAE